MEYIRNTINEVNDTHAKQILLYLSKERRKIDINRIRFLWTYGHQ